MLHGLFLLVVGFSPNLPTRAAGSVSPFVRVYVVAAEGMSFRAVCFAGVAGGWAVAPQQVDAQCHRFKMGRIEATRDFAQMIKRETFRNRSGKVSVSGSMNGNTVCYAIAPQPCLSISFDGRSGPEPAIVRAAARFDRLNADEKVHTLHVGHASNVVSLMTNA